MRTYEETKRVQEVERQKNIAHILIKGANEKRKFDRIIREIEKDMKYHGDESRSVIILIQDNLKLLERSKLSCEESQQLYEMKVEKIGLGEDLLWINQLLDDYHETIRKAKMFINKNDRKEINHTHGNLKLEKIKFDEFDGTLRKYQKFKQEFIKIIKPRYGKEEEAFALRSYLAPRVREEIEHLGDNCAQIWKRLDEKFGNESRFIDSIMFDIKRLKINKEDYGVETLKLIYTVERAHRDLKMIGREREISNAAIVATLEEKLPKKIEDNWLEIVTGDQQLLLKHKSMIEYKLAAIRRTVLNRGVSHHAGVDNQVEVNSLVSTEDRKPRCWLHPEETTHPIWKCPSLINMSAKERIEAARINRVCFRCFGVGHPVRLCRRSFKCRIENCEQPHHDLLHEACTSVTSYHGIHDKIKGTGDVLLQIQNIPCKQENGKSDNINVLWDSGSTVSFITFKKALNLKLRSVTKG